MAKAADGAPSLSVAVCSQDVLAGAAGDCDEEPLQQQLWNLAPSRSGWSKSPVQQLAEECFGWLSIINKCLRMENFDGGFSVSCVVFCSAVKCSAVLCSVV
jgi:hypothetical protein